MIIVDCEQNTPEWKAARLGVPTASSASKIITSKGEKSKSLEGYAQKLAGDIKGEVDQDAWQGNQYTARGHELEDEARSAYELKQLVDFKLLVDVDQVGFCKDDTGAYGASPDGLISDDGILEIKCLPKEHISTLLAYKETQKTPTIRIPQTQMQLLVTGRKWCDLWFYNPNPRIPSLRIRQYPDLEYHLKLKFYLGKVIEERDRVLKILREY